MGGDEQVIQFTLQNSELPVFYAYLALGMLRAIKSRAVSPDVGIWTLAHPNVSRFLQANDALPDELREILESCEKLSVEGALSESFLDELIERLEVLLKTLPEKNVLPSLRWLSGEGE
jgi:hypothetical protein